MDEEFNLETTRGKKKAQQGRRANKDDGETATTGDGGAGEARDQPKGRRGGWDDDAPPRTAGGSRRPNTADDELGDEKFKERSYSDSDDDAGTAAIPELKEESAAPAANLDPPEMAVAPSIAVNRVATYRELDFDLNRHASFATLDNEIDLKLLTRCLAADQDLLEPDEYWDWDRLFTEVTSDLLTDSGEADAAPGPAVATAGDQKPGGGGGPVSVK